MHGCGTSHVADDIIIQKHTSTFQHSLHDGDHDSVLRICVSILAVSMRQLHFSFAIFTCFPSVATRTAGITRHTGNKN